jgi:high-affinity nickel-transport protein
MGRMFGAIYRRIHASWQMFPVGFLFGLGFDTATEIAVLSFSGEAASNGKLPVWAIMIFPLMFTAGMTMVDSMDGALMMGMYDWAFSDPRKKLSFNMTITGLSALIALSVALIEWVQFAGSHVRLLRPLWATVAKLDFSSFGLAITVVMLTVWCFALMFYRRRLVVSSSTEK